MFVILKSVLSKSECIEDKHNDEYRSECQSDYASYSLFIHGALGQWVVAPTL
jgi:hypothetical protein